MKKHAKFMREDFNGFIYRAKINNFTFGRYPSGARNVRIHFQVCSEDGDDDWEHTELFPLDFRPGSMLSDFLEELIGEGFLKQLDGHPFPFLKLLGVHCCIYVVSFFSEELLEFATMIVGVRPLERIDLTAKYTPKAFRLFLKLRKLAGEVIVNRKTILAAKTANSDLSNEAQVKL